MTDDGTPDILSRIKQTRNLIYNGEMCMRGAMFQIIDPKAAPIRSEYTAGDASPQRSETSHVSFTKSNLTKKGTEKEAVEEVLSMKKQRSNFSKTRGEHRKNTSSFGFNKADSVGDYAYFNNLENTGSRERGSVKKLPSTQLKSPQKEGPKIDFTEHEQENDIFSEGVSEHSVKRLGTFKGQQTQNAKSANNLSLNMIEDYSDRDLEVFLFGSATDGDHYIPPRVQDMDQTEMARYIFGYLKIKEKKHQYELDQYKKSVETTLIDHSQRIDQTAKEAREYNMVLHTELEEFVNNKKKEFYQKFLEIKKVREEQTLLKDTFGNYMMSVKQI